MYKCKCSIVLIVTREILPCGPGKDVNQSKHGQMGMYVFAYWDIDIEHTRISEK